MSLRPLPTHACLAFGSGHLILDPGPHPEINSASPRPCSHLEPEAATGAPSQNPRGRSCSQCHTAPHRHEGLSTPTSVWPQEPWGRVGHGPFSTLTVAKGLHGASGLGAVRLRTSSRPVGFCPQDRMTSATAPASTLIPSRLASPLYLCLLFTGRVCPVTTPPIMETTALSLKTAEC